MYILSAFYNDIMKESTASRAIRFIDDHPTIKSCLKKGLINHSALSRHIAESLGIKNKTSKDAILIASRRYEERLKRESVYENEIRDILSSSEMEIKNHISVFILRRNAAIGYVHAMQRKVINEGGLFFLLEGSSNFTIITQDKYAEKIKRSFHIEEKRMRSSQSCQIFADFYKICSVS